MSVLVNAIVQNCCGKVADKYVEYDSVIIFIDLILHRARAYRHVLFNRTPYLESGLSAEHWKMLIIYLLLESWVKLVKIKSDPVDFSTVLFLIVLSTIEMFVYYGGIALAVKSSYGDRYAIIKYNYLMMALLLSSFGKCFFMVVMVWDYDQSYISLFNAFVMTSNVVALRVFLATSTLHAASFVSVGVCAKILMMFIVFFFDDRFRISLV